MNLTVLYGGPSAEREVSLVSGKAVIEALRQAGHTVFASDVSPTDLSGLDHPADVIFPVLHGEFGESGELQAILEQRGLPFVGSGSQASRLGMNKLETKRVWEAAGLPTPPWHLAEAQPPDSARGPWRIGAPCVVKALASGSSIDVFVCKTEPQANQACQKVLAAHGKALIEKFIEGVELTVGILEERALHPIRITTSREFFDFQAKYVGNDAQHHFDLNLPEPVVAQVKDLALKAHQAVECRDLSRVDVIIDREMQPWLLEINTIPGFTPKSLLPEMAAHEGISFVELVDRLVKRAHARGPDPRVATDVA